jgi:Tfp pilus assembly protein PilF
VGKRHDRRQSSTRGRATRAGAVESNRDRRAGLAAAMLLVSMTVVAYVPVFSAGFVWDDDYHVTENRNLRSLDGLRRLWFQPSRPGQLVTPQYYPLTHTTFWLEHQLWDDDPFGYHVVNVLLHACSALLLWTILRRLRMPGAWVAAAIWAVHPVMVESVAWVTERKNVLSGVFYWAAILAYARFDGLFEDEPRPRRLGWYAAAFVAFACALLSKTVTSTLPAAVLLLTWCKRGTIRAKDVWPLLPFFLAGAGMGSVTAWMERHVVGATGADWNLTLAERVLIAGRAVCFYASKLLVPVGLSFNYERWDLDPSAAWQWALPAAVAAASLVLFAWRRRIGRAPLAAWLFFVGTLAPALGFFDVYPMRFSFVADHFQYLASAGAIVLVVHGVAVATRHVARRSMATVTALVLVGLVALTAARARAFHDSEALWRDTLAENPRSWLAYLNLERHYASAGRLDLAVDAVRAALALRPNDPKAISQLALDLSRLGRRDEARREHERAIETEPHDAGAIYNYGQDLARWGEIDAAEQRYREAIELDPTLLGVHNNLGLLLADRGDVAAAMALYEQELAIDPESTRTLTNVANLLLRSQKLAEAETTLREALRIDPDFAVARNTLAIVLLRRGDAAGAEREARRALEQGPTLAEAHNSLGGALMAQQRFAEAVVEYRAALRMGLRQAETNLNLAIEASQRSAPGR